MGWEYRGNRLYYYHKQRIGSRVVSEYVDAGTSGYLVAMLDKEDRLERQYNATKMEKQRMEMQKINHDVDQLSKTINAFVRAMFLTSGFHPHKGQWRQIRHE
jgi:hypothetical protein